MRGYFYISGLPFGAIAAHALRTTSILASLKIRFVESISWARRSQGGNVLSGGANGRYDACPWLSDGGYRTS